VEKSFAKPASAFTSHKDWRKSNRPDLLQSLVAFGRARQQGETRVAV
jgi:hypothetical protein